MAELHDIRTYNVVFSNHISRRYAGKRLSPTQEKFIRLCIAHISNGTLNDTYFRINDFIRVMAVKRGKKSVIDEIISLKDTTFGLKNDPTEYKWFETLEEVDGNFHAKLDKSIGNLVLCQTGNFTMYTFGFVCRLSGAYTLPLYEFCRSWLDCGKKDISKAMLTGLLQFPYKKVADIERRVIDPAVKEINEKTDIVVSYTRIMDAPNYSERKECIGFLFTFSVKDYASQADLLRESGVHDREMDFFERGKTLTKDERRECFLVSRRTVAPDTGSEE